MAAIGGSDSRDVSRNSTGKKRKNFFTLKILVSAASGEIKLLTFSTSPSVRTSRWVRGVWPLVMTFLKFSAESLYVSTFVMAVAASKCCLGPESILLDI